MIVDDDEEIQDLLTQYLQKNQFEITSLFDGSKVQETLEQKSIDLIILDIMLPGDDGYEICRKVRKSSNVPIIMLTAAGEELDRVVGLEVGADDYIAKPFSFRELLARIRAVLRRPGNLTMKEGPKEQGFQFNGWKVDTNQIQLVNPDNIVISLSTAEYRLLLVFLENPNRILTRDRLLDLTQGREAVPFDRTIDIQVSRLRNKLQDKAKTPVMIKTVRSEGYIFLPEVRRIE